MSPRRAARRIAALALAGALGTGGCAYFNTFFNAKAAFRKAEAERRTGQGTKGADNYQKAIEKCQTLLRYYSKSKYVDDALYMIATARLHRGEYAQARASYEGLLERFPDSEYVERAYYHMGLAALEQGDPAGASQAFDQLRERFPKSDLNLEAAFRTAESQVETGDNEAARRELEAFIAAHPESKLVGEAHLRIADTYLEEKRYAEARVELAKALKFDVTPEVRYEAELDAALALRSEAEEVIANPVLQPATRLHKAAAAAAKLRPKPAGADSLAAGVAADTTHAVIPAPRVDPAQLAPELAADLAAAEQKLDEAAASLLGLRKPAARLGRQVQLDTEIAVLRALRGEPEEAQADLDQLARTHARTELAALAHYEIGEIRRRLGDYDRARESYDASLREKRDSPVGDAADRKSKAIALRATALGRLRDAAEFLERWERANGARALAGADSAGTAAAEDSLGAQLTLLGEFEALASHQLQIAEIDLFELEQPLLAMHEMEMVLLDYAGSLVAPRAAFGIAWIYEHRLRDLTRARASYERVARDYPDTPQGREAQAILEAAASGQPKGEGGGSSSRP